MIKSKRRSRSSRKNKQKRINKTNNNNRAAKEETVEEEKVDENSVEITEINESNSDSETVSENKGIVCEVENETNPQLVETPLQRKAKKKEALMQYFLPVYYNPRFLEVISEESSDANSDRESKITQEVTFTEIPTHSEQIISDTNVEVVFLPDGSTDDEESQEDQQKITKSSALSPSRSPSLSSNEGSSSRGTSLCTARYNPSIGDIASLTKDEELAQVLSNLRQPLSLREICLNFLLSQPFGAEVLKELANVSRVIDKFTSTLPSTLVSSLLKGKVRNESYSQFLAKLKQNVNNNFNNIPVAMNNKEKEENPDLYLYYEENDKSRLQAKELSEWLELARNKSVSETNLTKITTKNRNYSRRGSLPNDFYQQQLALIREKEREIQQQLEELEEEKRKLLSSAFIADDYIISTKGDIAIYNENKKPFNTVATPTEAETFRQQMYDEYMQQLAERDDRRLNKVIKLSAPPNENSVKESKFETIHPADIEDEFMEQVKRRKLGGGGGDKEDSDEISSSVLDDDLSEPIIILEGSSVSSCSRTLPRHIQEFAEGECMCDGRKQKILTPNNNFYFA